VAPVVRVYRRGPSAIGEIDCGSAGPGGSASASLETVRLQDPLTGWQFNRLLRVALGGSVGCRPLAEGRWRLRASFRGTIDASPSRSGYVHLLVERKV
jgi:hypothetical protein